jgi:hypothetical protein
MEQKYDVLKMKNLWPQVHKPDLSINCRVQDKYRDSRLALSRPLSFMDVVDLLWVSSIYHILLRLPIISSHYISHHLHMDRRVSNSK